MIVAVAIIAFSLSQQRGFSDRMPQPFCKERHSAGLLRARYVETQIDHATDIKKHVLVDIYKTKEHVLASGASCHKAWAMHVYVCFSEAFRGATFSAPSRCSRDIDGKYFAQFAGGGIAVEVIVVGRTHVRPPVGPKRSVLILSGRLPQARSTAAVVSTNDVGPHT
jgi:hypothetical protein